MIGCVFPASIFIYEKFFGPIAPEYLTEGRGGGERIQGAYADVMNYAIYIVTSFLIASYFFLKKMNKGLLAQKDFVFLGFVLVMNILGLVAIKQVSTFIVMGVLILFFLSYLSQNKSTIGLVIILLPLGL